jgi:hypothetical protein
LTVIVALLIVLCQTFVSYLLLKPRVNLVEGGLLFSGAFTLGLFATTILFATTGGFGSAIIFGAGIFSGAIASYAAAKKFSLPE